MRAIQDRPQVSIESDGSSLAADEVRALAGVRVKQALSVPTQCELAFRETAGSLTGAARLVPGTPLRVVVRGHSEPLFAGQVTAIEQVYESAHGHEILVRGYDLMHRLRKRQAVRAHVDVTTRSLVEELASDVGLSVEADQAGPRYPRIIQHRQSDLELLTEVMERCGLYYALRGSVLHLLTLEGLGDPLPLRLGESLLEVRVEVNADSVCRTVKASGWDPLQDVPHEGSVTQARVGRQVLAEVVPDRVGTTGKRELPDEAAPDDQHAEALAQAELDLRQAREVVLFATAEGDPRLQPGARVQVAGIDDSVAGRYVLTEVTHTVDEQGGFVSHLSTAPPAPHDRPRSAIATPGVVTQVDDPDKKGRVKVQLPTYGNLETEWMGVLSAGAGPGKGLVTLPDVGDHVLVLLAHENPTEGMVLGGLYGTQGAYDPGVESGAVKRYSLVTHGGLRLQFDDGKKSIRLTDTKGSYVELSPQRVRVHAATELELDAPGHRVVIRGQSIDFEKA